MDGRELGLWMVGGDTTLGYSDCSGRPLTVGEHVDLFADSLVRIFRTIRLGNPDAQVIAHFLGDSTLSYAGETGQPRELQALLLDRLDGSPYDLLVSDLDPSLLADRQDNSSLLQLGVVQPALEGGGATAEGGEPSVGGWHLPAVLEEFEDATSDLEATYSAWQDFRTNTEQGGTTVPDIEVPSPPGLALLRLIDPLSQFNHKATATGAVSTGSVDFIPDQHFAGAGSASTSDPVPGIESKLWTFVSDFFPDVAPDPSGPHVTAFLRVHDREWGGFPDQTRFGSILFGPHNTSQCGNSLQNPSSLAALQITSDETGTNQAQGLTYLYCFAIEDATGPDDPWDPVNTDELYRVQIFEKEIVTVFGIRIVFKAQVYRLGQGGAFLGESPWLTSATIELFGMTVPPSLTNSRVFWGMGPRSENGTVSGVDVERVGSTYWDYNQ